MSNYHISVLLQEAVDALQIQKGKKYIDATLGAGGHSFEMLKQGALILGIDQDEEALEEVKENFKFQVSNFKLKLAQGNFGNIAQIARENGFEKVSGVLFDIGVSSHQLDTNIRGFSFLTEGPLDMRMNSDLATTAADLVNGLHKGELIDLFTKYGEEPFARKVAQVIVKNRLEKPIQTTKELADLVARSVPKIGKTHPATRIFQALRIVVNDELNVLEQGLKQATDLLEKNGRLVVITFHSLEDRIVKRAFEKYEGNGLGKIITKKPIVPLDTEIESNKRARSAKMRVFEKI
ncbi:MAG TPA: 16S rRNA (cytosine(1402)-N(4))-methyltransferase RsmH [Candidatus Eisenbacteria bacterium]|nr:16S rRNA (cytosine(1402)-N(4))-methyltransferase RsmH [Candidatus Eisenbacteria bacterium]